MKQIELSKVNKDNTNIRKYSDSLWRALRKERFKKATPDVFTNEMAGEEFVLQRDPHIDFNHDVSRFIEAKLNDKEAQVFKLFVYGGRITQCEIGEALGMCQATVHNLLQKSLSKFKEWYYPEGLND